MKPETLFPCPIAYLRRTGAYGAANFALMEQLKSLAAAAGLCTERAVFYAVAWDDPTRTAPAKCRFDACLALGAGQTLHSAAVRYGTLPGGRYAVFQLPHTAQAVAQAWQSLGALYAENHLAPDLARPVLERYAEPLVRQGQCEFLLPILPPD